MNQKICLFSAMIIAATAAVISLLSGCAEMEATNTKSLLTQAGFHTLTPTTPLQKEIYGHLTPNRVERVDAKGKTAYVFKDEKAGLAYVGHEMEYQRYRDLCIRQKIREDYYMAYNIDPYWGGRWSGAWGPRGMYW